ncbi:hemolysin family protein [Comamonas jiangduensis]|uniref:hemolysin family protein n=1 Tax=Comamonas jiangduensis TaxID=1194168 RepID=UPI001C55BA79|nr:hemolysin family protein [Comamonas jiangduensis]QXW18415.1 hemolysin family protein [Comamonas aquatica]
MEIPILIALIVLNGLFAMSEIALVTARKARLQKLIDEGDTAAAAALKLGEDPTRFLSTIQIGITSIGVLNGIFGEAALAQPMSVWLIEMGMAANYASTVSTAVVVVVITYVSIVVGELVPKRLGQTNPESIARLVARPINLLAKLTKPFVLLLTSSTRGLLRILGVKESNESSVTEDEIHAVLAEGTTSGAIEQNEHTMIRNLFRLDDRQISSLMVPRSDVVCLDVSLPFEANMAILESQDHARYPVIDGNFENLLGVINSRQWLANALKGKRDLRESSELIQKPIYIPETITGMELLENFKISGSAMTFVIDEYGEVQGIVTVRDVTEAITGEFVTEDPSDAWAVQRDDGSWLLDGHIPIMELKDRLGLKTVPEEEKGRYQTLSGMLMLLTGKLPSETDKVIWESWEFEVVDMDGKIIDKIQATKIEEPPIDMAQEP